jgi:hypothetical protein
MKNLLVILSLSSLVMACAQATPVTTPSGNRGFAVSCGAALLDECYAKAGEVCPSGYEILDQQGSRYLGQLSTGNAYANSGGNAFANRTNAQANYNSNARANYSSLPMMSPNKLLIECK